MARENDASTLTAVLDHQFSTASFAAVVDDWLLPALRELGEAWKAGEVTVAGEHLVAHGVARRLASAYDAARRAGLATTYLGPAVPVDDWVAFVASNPVEAAVVSAATAEDAGR